MRIERLTPSTDLAALVRSIHVEEWDEANAFSPFDLAALARIAHHDDYLFLLARPDESDEVIGQLLATRLYKTDGTLWLYVDEVDTHPRWRRQGVATALMRAAMEQARAWGASELWLGAEKGDAAANGLYGGLGEPEVGEVVGYTWEVE